MARWGQVEIYVCIQDWVQEQGTFSSRETISGLVFLIFKKKKKKMHMLLTGLEVSFGHFVHKFENFWFIL